MSQQLYSLVYVSSATTLFTDGELEVLLAPARERNRLHQVTGMLLYGDGSFIQALEGTQSGLDAVLAHIRQTRHHKGMITLYHEPIAQREFGDWNMAVRQIERSEFKKANKGSEPARLLLRAVAQSMR